MAKLLRLLLAGLITAAGAFQVVRLVTPADGTADVRRQLAYVRAELESGAAEEAQRQFPEGYFFLHALYGLAAVNLGQAPEARWALTRLETDAARAQFAGDMQPRWGVFYRGWTNWLRGGIVALSPSAEDTVRFRADSAALAAAFDESATPFLPSYPGRAWPVDSTVALASLALHDRLFPPLYRPILVRWVAGARANLDPGTGLIPHTADIDTGFMTAGARGTSQSLINRFLPEIDAEFSREQYVRFRGLFLSTPLGLGPAVREYPPGVSGPADVDSGPLPLGISLPATVVTLGAARVHRDDSLAGALATFGEVAGLPLDTPSTRRYAFGAVPIGDAFLAWAKSDRAWTAPSTAWPGTSAGPPGAGSPGSPAAAPAAGSTVPPAGSTVPPGGSARWRLPLLSVFLVVCAFPWVLSAVRRRRVRTISS
jgi:hypothetical protein